MRYLPSAAATAVVVFGTSTIVLAAEGNRRHRGLIQGENQIECDDVDGCSWGKLGSSYTERLWVSHPNVYWRCNEPGMVALTYDDGPSLETINVLDQLQAEGVIATFFVNAYQITDTTGPMMTRAEAEGHVIAHHTYDHSSIADQVERNSAGGLTTESLAFFEHQIDDAIAVASPFLPTKGLRPYLRPPYLELDEEAATYLEEKYEMYVVQINVDTKDYEDGATKASIKTAFKGNLYDDSTENSWVSLQHDLYSATTAAIPAMIAYGKSLGYRFVGIDECLGFPHEKAPVVSTKTPTVPTTSSPLICDGEPCTEESNECRSRFGWCGTSDAHCLDEPTWVPACSASTTRPTSIKQPTTHPSSQPSRSPTTSPPTSQPSIHPTAHPSTQPTSQPSHSPTTHPTAHPSTQPTSQPSHSPTTHPTAHPSTQPTTQPTMIPTAHPSKLPTLAPSNTPSKNPTKQPSRSPSASPSTLAPTELGETRSPATRMPTHRPSKTPTHLPTTTPSQSPTALGETRAPSHTPTKTPSRSPTHDNTATNSNGQSLFYRATFAGVFRDTLHGRDKYELEMEDLLAVSLGVFPISRVSAKIYAGSIIVDFSIAPERVSGDAFSDDLEEMREDLNATFFGDVASKFEVGTLQSLIRIDSLTDQPQSAEPLSTAVIFGSALIGIALVSIGIILYRKLNGSGSNLSYESSNEKGHSLQQDTNRRTSSTAAGRLTRAALPRWRNDSSEYSFTGAPPNQMKRSSRSFEFSGDGR